MSFAERRGILITGTLLTLAACTVFSDAREVALDEVPQVEPWVQVGVSEGCPPGGAVCDATREYEVDLLEMCDFAVDVQAAAIGAGFDVIRPADRCSDGEFYLFRASKGDACLGVFIAGDRTAMISVSTSSGRSDVADCGSP